MVVVARLMEEGEDFSELIGRAEAVEEPVLPEKLKVTKMEPGDFQI